MSEHGHCHDCGGSDGHHLMIVFTMEQMADIPRIREEKEQMSLPVSVGLFI